MRRPPADQLVLLGLCMLLLSAGCTDPGLTGAIEAEGTTAEITPLQGRVSHHPLSFGKDPELQWLRAARTHLQAGDPLSAIDLLQAKVEGMSTVGNVALGYQTLGDAQWMLSHARLAGAYYAQAYAAEPSAQRLWLMATANDAGGDYELALGQYLQLARWPGPEADEYREPAQGRIAQIIDIIGTPTPSPGP
jgi:hypothetical protein